MRCKTFEECWEALKPTGRGEKNQFGHSWSAARNLSRKVAKDIWDAAFSSAQGPKRDPQSGPETSLTSSPGPPERTRDFSDEQPGAEEGPPERTRDFSDEQPTPAQKNILKRIRDHKGKPYAGIPFRKINGNVRKGLVRRGLVQIRVGFLELTERGHAVASRL